MRVAAAALLLILVYSPALAAPVISDVTGTVSNGQTITISGTDFGATGPTILVFDDFELGSNGTSLSDQVRSAQVGSWRDLSSMSPYFATYSNLNVHGGSLAMRNNWGSGGDGQEGQRFISPTSTSLFSQVYISFWTYLPAGQNVPAGGLGPNWKVWWLSTDDLHQNDYASEIISDPPTHTSMAWVDGSQTRICAPTCEYVSFSFTKGRWLRWEAYLSASTSAGTVSLWHTDSGQARNLFGTASGRTIDDGTTGWRYIHFPGFGRYDTNSSTYYDDIYVATGTGARARVELGNNATYSFCTNLAICTPTSWGASSITATVRSGAFASGSAYLFIVDSSGNASSGYAVTIGSSSGGSPPPGISGGIITGGSMQ